MITRSNQYTTNLEEPMSDNAQLARTGSAAGAIVIGTTVITGWWLLAIALGLITAGALTIRFGFRRGRNAGQQ
jgi:acyl dehydratase